MADLKETSARQGAQHSLSLSSREHAELAGVTEVNSFDEECVVLSTVCGELTVEGEGLRVGTLDMTRGVLVIDGKISGLYYADTSQTRKKGFLGGFRRVK